MPASVCIALIEAGHNIIYARRNDLKRVLLTGADLTIANTDGNTALHLGARTGELAIIQSLLSTERLWDACSPEHSHTPLMAAVFGFHLRDRVNMQRITEVLIAANADLNAVDHVGQNALLVALWQVVRSASVYLHCTDRGLIIRNATWTRCIGL